MRTIQEKLSQTLIQVPQTTSSQEKIAESATAECADYATRITSDTKEQPVNQEIVEFD